MTDSDRAADLIYDWNEVDRKGRLIPKDVTFFDETLRDGLQNPSVVDPDDRGEAQDPPPDGRPRHPRRRHRPARQLSKRAFDDVLRMCKEVVDCKMKITHRLRGAHRGQRHHADDRGLAARRACPIEVYAFIGSSPDPPVRRGLGRRRSSRSAAPRRSTSRVKAGLPVAYVTEDTTRSRPEVLDDALPTRDRSRRDAPLPLATPSATPRPTACAT